MQTTRRVGFSRLLRMTATLGALALVAGACGSDGSSGSGGGVTFTDYNTLTARPASIDPALATEVSGAQVAANLYDGLTDYDFTNPKVPVLKPLVASSYTSNADATVWTFVIKKGLTFSNGDPVLPSSFAYAWNRLANPDLAAGYSYLIEDIEGFDAVADGKTTKLSGLTADDQAMTLTVKLSTSNAEFPGIASLVPLSPLPEQQVEKLGPIGKTGKWAQGVMIGNGPFVEDGKPDLSKEVVFTPNPKWAGDVVGTKKPKIDKLVFKVSKNLTAGYTALQAGDADSSAIPDGKYGEVAANWGNTIDDLQLSTYYFAFGMDRPDIGGAKNVKFRQAVNLAIDRAQIAKAIYQDSRPPATGFTPPGVPGYEDGLCHYCAYQPDEAKKLLTEWKQAGGKQDGPLAIQFGEGQGHDKLVQLVQNDLAAVGIEATSTPMNADTYFSATAHGECQLCRSGWAWDYPSFYNGLTIFGKAAIAPDDPPDSEGNNQGRFDDPAYDGLLDQAISTTDDSAREKLYRQAESYLLNDATAIVPVVFYGGTIAYAKNVTGLVQNPLSLVAWERVGLK